MSETQVMQGRTVLVTGASRGIGRACALELARQGAHVIALARTQGALEELDDEITQLTGNSATLIPLDLTKFQEIDKLGAAIYERFGKLDAAVLAAGTLGVLTPAHQLEHKDLERVMRLNFTANTRLIRSLDPLFRASDNARIIALSGAVAEKPYAFFGAYAASKAALETFVKAYAAELSQTSIHINIARLPAINTALLDSAFPGGYPYEAFAPETVARPLVNLLHPDFVQQGQVLTVKPVVSL